MYEPTHGCGTSLRYNGNDGGVMVEEYENGYVKVRINANDAVLTRLEVTVNGKAVILDER